MKKRNFIRVLGLIAAVAGTGVTLVTDWVNEQKMDEMVDAKVREALAEQSSEYDEEES